MPGISSPPGMTSFFKKASRQVFIETRDPQQSIAVFN